MKILQVRYMRITFVYLCGQAKNKIYKYTNNYSTRLFQMCNKCSNNSILIRSQRLKYGFIARLAKYVHGRKSRWNLRLFSGLFGITFDCFTHKGDVTRYDWTCCCGNVTILTRLPKLAACCHNNYFRQSSYLYQFHFLVYPFIGSSHTLLYTNYLIYSLIVTFSRIMRTSFKAAKERHEKAI